MYIRKCNYFTNSLLYLYKVASRTLNVVMGKSAWMMNAELDAGNYPQCYFFI
jgi:hypothetical protein